MRARTVLVILVILVAAALMAGLKAEQHAETQARLKLRSVAAQLAEQGVLQYDTIEAHAWGSGQITGLRFTPSESFRQSLGLPAGMSIEIPLLRFDHWTRGPDWPSSLHLSLQDATLNREDAEPRSLQGELDWQHDAGDGALKLSPNLRLQGVAALHGTLQLQVPQPGHRENVSLTQAHLTLRDEGALRRLRTRLVMRMSADPQQANAALADQLSQWMRSWSVPPDARQLRVLQQFAAEPVQLTINLSPDEPVPLDKLSLYRAEDRGRLLGLTLSAP